VKEERPERGEKPRLKIEVKECLGYWLVVLPKKFSKGVAAEMVNYTRR